jgi:hypothetical protein
MCWSPTWGKRSASDLPAGNDPARRGLTEPLGLRKRQAQALACGPGVLSLARPFFKHPNDHPGAFEYRLRSKLPMFNLTKLCVFVIDRLKNGGVAQLVRAEES